MRDAGLTLQAELICIEKEQRLRFEVTGLNEEELKEECFFEYGSFSVTLEDEEALLEEFSEHGSSVPRNPTLRQQYLIKGLAFGYAAQHIKDDAVQPIRRFGLSILGGIAFECIEERVTKMKQAFITNYGDTGRREFEEADKAVAEIFNNLETIRLGLN